MGSVVEVIHLPLAFLGKLNCQHVYGQVELGLSLVEVLLIDVVTGDLCCMSGQQNQWVVVNTEGTNVMATLLAETSLVFVLKSWGANIFDQFHNANCGEIKEMLQKLKMEGNMKMLKRLTSLTMSREALAATTEIASLGRKYPLFMVSI